MPTLLDSLRTNSALALIAAQVATIARTIRNSRISSHSKTETSQPQMDIHLRRSVLVMFALNFWMGPNEPLHYWRMQYFFRVRSQVTFKDKTSYWDISVSGDIFVCNQLKQYVKVGLVSFQQEDNPIVACIQCHGITQGSLTALPNDGYPLTNTEVQLSLILLSSMNHIWKSSVTSIP